MAEIPRYAASGIQGPDIKRIRKDRLGLFLETENYANVNLRKFLDYDRTDQAQHISLKVYSVPSLQRPSFSLMLDNAFWRPAQKGELFGPSWSTHWFKVEIKSFPDGWSALDGPFALEFDLAEGLIYDAGGRALQGLTGSAADGNSERTEWLVPQDTALPLTLYIEEACNGLFGNGSGGMIQAPTAQRYFTLAKADLVAPDWAARALRRDFEILRECAETLHEDALDAQRALDVANKVMDAFDREDRKSVAACRAIAAHYLGSLIDTARVYGPEESTTQVFAVGNTHIDTAWLWPYAETRRKIARSWSSQLDLLDRYPEMKFTASQAQQFVWLEEDHPELFRRIQAAAEAGRFETIGGTWVESDTNLPSGESLCRQFLYGQKYFKEKFGSYSTTYWLPDTFGYSAALPQLARLSGARFFFTQKLSWNAINPFPLTTFRWVGLDGSQVLCHMAPTETYNAECRIDEVVRSETRHKSLLGAPAALLAYGFGDGGGGPTADMLERLRRCRGAADNGARSLPKVATSTVKQFFEAVEKQSEAGSLLKAWHGDLYLEFHRGTYTTHARIKAHNVRAEHLLREVEWYGTTAAIQDPSYKYPRAEIRGLWHDTLLNQFHDILPGSAIELAYIEAEQIYAGIFERAERLLAQQWQQLGLQRLGATEILDSTISAYDSQPLTFPRSGFIDTAVGPKLAWVEPQGRIRLSKSVADATAEQRADGVIELKNAKWSLSVEAGRIVQIIDKTTSRALLAAPAGFLLFEDEPLQWQAWDIELTYLLKKPRILQGVSTIVSHDPHKIIVRTAFKLSNASAMTVDMSFSASDGSCSPNDVWSSLEFSCDIDWHEDKKMLRFVVPSTLVSQRYSVGTQFGRLEHATHANTTLDEAKFETCHHNWFDLTEGNLGLSIFTVDKFGSRVLGRDLSLALLRAPKAPDVHADMHRHKFRFAMAVHRAPLSTSGVTTQSLSFAHPIDPVQAAAAGSTDAILSSSIRPIRLHGLTTAYVSALKLAEESDAMIVRIFEGEGNSGAVRIVSHLGMPKRAQIVDILERTIDGDNASQRLAITSDEAVLIHHLRAFEVLTIKLTF